MKNRVLLIRLLITFIVGLLVYYFMLPPFNLSSPTFWGYLFLLISVFIITGILKLTDLKTILIKKATINSDAKSYAILILSLLGIVILLVLINVFQSPLFRSKSYYNRIGVSEDGDFSKDVDQVAFNALPLLDKDSSQKLGDRVMGQMPELVSQFEVSNLYTQINYNNSIIRVTPLEYNGLIKYFTNRSGGVKGYITVNSVTGDTQLIKLNNGMKYMPSAYFFENLDRKLRLMYPTTIFGQETFELDNDGNPYWIIPTVKYSGIGLRKEINGVIILDPITGKSKKYKVSDVPTWVDHVYSAELIIEQVNDWGKYKNGFLNSIFGQKNVVQTTTGYNYTVMNDDVYLYTGITSALADESNIGFILTNLRTKETTFYSVPGAEEYSAMASAQGQVQQMNYSASFPLLVNLNNKPTYLISLKDNAGLVKMYALVDVADYQKVVVTESSLGIKKAFDNYLKDTGNNTNNISKANKSITVSSITTTIIDGNTYYYIVDQDGKKYSISIKNGITVLPFVKPSDTLKIYFSEESDVTELNKVEI